MSRALVPSRDAAFFPVIRNSKTNPNKQMAQKKETKKIKVRDLKPQKDAKGGIPPGPPDAPVGRGITRPGNSNT
jgi:hypothetical protein